MACPRLIGTQQLELRFLGPELALSVCYFESRAWPGLGFWELDSIESGKFHSPPLLAPSLHLTHFRLSVRDKVILKVVIKLCQGQLVLTKHPYALPYLPASLEVNLGCVTSFRHWTIKRSDITSMLKYLRVDAWLSALSFLVSATWNSPIPETIYKIKPGSLSHCLEENFFGAPMDPEQILQESKINLCVLNHWNVRDCLLL